MRNITTSVLQGSSLNPLETKTFYGLIAGSTAAAQLQQQMQGISYFNGRNTSLLDTNGVFISLYNLYAAMIILQAFQVL